MTGGGGKVLDMERPEGSEPGSERYPEEGKRDERRKRGMIE